MFTGQDGIIFTHEPILAGLEEDKASWVLFLLGYSYDRPLL